MGVLISFVLAEAEIALDGVSPDDVNRLCARWRTKYNRAYMPRIETMMIHRGTKLARRRTLSEVNQHPGVIETSVVNLIYERDEHTSPNIAVARHS